MTRTAGLLGKAPAQRVHGLATLATYAQRRLPTPPVKVNAPNLDWGMDGNDRWGCCTIAGAAHVVACANAEEHTADVVPDTAAVVEQYLTLTGGTDTGLVEANVLRQWAGKGLFGANRIAGFAPVGRSLTRLHQAVAFYGCAYIGVQLPRSAQEQFEAGKAWTVDPDSPIEGGHCVIIVGYDPHAVQVVTWGQVAEVTYPWLAAYCDESWAVITAEAVEAGRGPSLDLAAMRIDLGLLAEV